MTNFTLKASSLTLILSFFTMLAIPASAKAESEEINFKTQDGIVMPFTMQQEGGPMGGATVSLTTITLNPKLDAKVFDTPAK